MSKLSCSVLVSKKVKSHTLIFDLNGILTLNFKYLKMNLANLEFVFCGFDLISSRYSSSFVRLSGTLISLKTGFLNCLFELVAFGCEVNLVFNSGPFPCSLHNLQILFSLLVSGLWCRSNLISRQWSLSLSSIYILLRAKYLPLKVGSEKNDPRQFSIISVAAVVARISFYFMNRNYYIKAPRYPNISFIHVGKCDKMLWSNTLIVSLTKSTCYNLFINMVAQGRWPMNFIVVFGNEMNKQSKSFLFEIITLECNLLDNVSY